MTDDKPSTDETTEPPASETPAADTSSPWYRPPSADPVEAETPVDPVKAETPVETVETPTRREPLPRAFPPARPPLVPILAAATAVLLILVILLGLMAFAPRIAPIKSGPTKLAARAQEEQEISAIARRFARNFVTIDYRTIDEDLERMSADATGNFKEQLERTIGAIGRDFEKRKARSTGRALDSAVLSYEDGTALVQVLLRRTKQNVGTKGPETGNQIVNVSLVRTDDGWKVDNLSQLGGEES
jgi:Mce-associated membrane protein